MDSEEKLKMLIVYLMTLHGILKTDPANIAVEKSMAMTIKAIDNILIF